MDGSARHILALSAAGLGDFMVYFVIAVAITALYLAIYLRVTPHREIALARQGNVAAAVSFAGALVGFVIPLASAIAHSASLLDALVWSGVALVIQLLAFAAACRLLPQLSAQIERGNVADAIVLAALHLGVGILNAACMTS